MQLYIDLVLHFLNCNFRELGKVRHLAPHNGRVERLSQSFAMYQGTE
jgi:hypothetical protein